nr:lipase 3-like [Onthophagus taurus]
MTTIKVLILTCLILNVYGGILPESWSRALKLDRKVPVDALLSVPELIEKAGYPCEIHDVVTQDGYILSLHRMAHGKYETNDKNIKKPVVFMQHGILASSGDWVLMGPNKALGYILVEMGYDVWMGNSRGNRYSRNHTYLATDSPEFWDFSWHELGVYDLPAMIDYVLETTGHEKLQYVGHSQGNTIFYVMCSERPEYNSKIISQFSMAPIAYVSHMKSPLLKTLSYGAWGLGQIFSLVGVNEFLPNSEFMANVGITMCKDGDFTQQICTNTIFALCGFNKAQMNTTMLPVILGHTPAGSSTKQLLHFSQEIKSGYFRQFDYGFIGNIKRYRSWNPPNYNLKNVKVPVYIFHSMNDWLSSYKDVMKLYSELANPQAYILVPDLKFNHLDFIFGIDAPSYVYKTLTALLLSNS